MIEIGKNHVLSKTPACFRISSYTQELMCYLGQQKVFSEAEEVFKVTKGVDISAKQIENVCHHYGNILQEENQLAIKKGHNYPYGEQEKETPHYLMADGSMYLTREEKWKEVKLARLFSAKNHIETISKNRGMITQSKYIAHVGSHKEFFLQVERYTDPLKKLIILADGAKWIWNWAELFYPDAVQILDFYHAKEHICSFALDYFTDEQQANRWIDEMTGLLLNDEVKKVISLLRVLPAKKRGTKIKRKQLINYFEENKKRMYYKTFTSNNHLIGSGPIESANRHVLQQRFKLSGQRWTMKGLQQVVNLRVANKNDDWDEVVDIIKKAA